MTWRYEEATKTIRSVPENYWIATMDSWDGAVNHEANAKLIAAAPELLACLESFHDAMHSWVGLDGTKYYICDTHPAYCEVRVAISKARGE